MNEDLDKKEVSAEALAQMSGGSRYYRGVNRELTDSEIARGRHTQQGGFSTTLDDGTDVYIGSKSRFNPSRN